MEKEEIQNTQSKENIEQERAYVIDESDEISLGDAEGWTNKFFSAFPAFKNVNYRYYFTGQFVSFIGTWLQIIAQGWLVFQLTHSAFLVGFIAALGTLPVLFFSLFSGVIVDRTPKKRLVLFTNIMFLILSLMLGILTITGHITVVYIGIIAFLMGVIDSLDKPARHAFVAKIVEKENLSSAIALNSGMFNAARIVGPALAGILIIFVGAGGAFIINALSYSIAFLALLRIKVKKSIPRIHAHPLIELKEGIAYVLSKPIIKLLLLFAGVSSIFGWSYGTIMPVVAQDIFHQGAVGLGYLYSAAGIGAVTSTFLVSAYSKKIHPIIFILGGNFVFAFSLLLFTFTSFLPLALLCLFFAGLGLISQFSTINSTLQHLVDNKIRGRVMSIYILVFIGFSPIGNLQIGFLSEHFGSQFAIRLGALVLLFFGAFLYFKRYQIQEEMQKEQHVIEVSPSL